MKTKNSDNRISSRHNFVFFCAGEPEACTQSFCSRKSSSSDDSSIVVVLNDNEEGEFEPLKSKCINIVIECIKYT